MNGENCNGSLEKCVDAPHTLRLKRSRILFPLAKGLAWSLIKPTSYKHYEIPKRTHQLMQMQKRDKDLAIYYVAPHKSMWETIGIPYAISWHDGDVPFVMMGNNLVKKDTGKWEGLLKYVLDRSGVVSVEREINPRVAVPIIISDIEKILSMHNNVLIFPEGTRARDGLIKPFKPAGFQGLAQSVSNGTQAYIVPVNVDYSTMIELEEFAFSNELGKLRSLMLSENFSGMNNPQKLNALRETYHNTHFIGEQTYMGIEDMISSENPDYDSQWKGFHGKYTFQIKDSKRWKAFIEDVYISFGEPMLVNSDGNHNVRKELADKSKAACLDLVKIQPINVLGEAILRMDLPFGAPINNHELYSSIAGVIRDISDYADRFKNFTVATKPSDIIIGSNIAIDSELMEEYRIISNQIHHYLPKR